MMRIVVSSCVFLCRFVCYYVCCYCEGSIVLRVVICCVYYSICYIVWYAMLLCDVMLCDICMMYVWWYYDVDVA